ncbi:MAG: hypothetical protein ACJ780_23400 [Solirubrobacteraceae bacterium]
MSVRISGVWWREPAVHEIEPRLRVTRAQASAGVEGGEAVHRGPRHFGPRATGIRECCVEARERQPKRAGVVFRCERHP